MFTEIKNLCNKLVKKNCFKTYNKQLQKQQSKKNTVSINIWVDHN